MTNASFGADVESIPLLQPIMTPQVSVMFHKMRGGSRPAAPTGGIHDFAPFPIRISETGVTYIHGTRAEEQRRLAKLNDLTNASFLDFLDLPETGEILDV